MIAKGALLIFPILPMLFMRDYSNVVMDQLRERGLSPSFHIMWAVVGALVRWVAAFLMLRVVAFGRLLYVIYIPLAFAVSVWLLGVYARDVVGLAVFLLFAFLLFRSPAKEFFAATTRVDAAPNA